MTDLLKLCCFLWLRLIERNGMLLGNQNEVRFFFTMNSAKSFLSGNSDKYSTNAAVGQICLTRCFLCGHGQNHHSKAIMLSVYA